MTSGSPVEARRVTCPKKSSRKLSKPQDARCSLSNMTDVSKTGRRRGTPLRLEDDILNLVAAGRDDLCDSDGKPVPNRIAKAAGINRQNLSPLRFDRYALGALARLYADSHGVSDKEAIAALLCIDKAEAAAA